MSKSEAVQVRVTPEMAADVATLGQVFRMYRCDIVRAIIDLALGNWSPFTAGEAQEVLRLEATIATEANDEAR